MQDTKRMRVIRDAIMALQDKSGRISAHVVVKAAKNPRHPLHGEFEWNDAKAAHGYRLERANELIRYVTVVTVSYGRKVVTPMYVRDPSRKSNEAGLIALTSDLIDRQNAEAIMLAELDRCEAAIRRARAVTGTLDATYPGLSQRLEAVLQQLIDVRDQLQAA